MLDHHHRVPRFHQALDDLHELFDVREVEPRGRLVHEVEGLARGTLGQLEGQLDPLGLPAREGQGGLPELDVAQPHGQEGVHAVGDRGDVLEEGGRLLDGHVQDLGNVLSLVADVQGVRVEALPVADVAGDVDVGQEVHLDPDGAVSLAVLAAAALHVEAEASGLPAPGLGFRQGGEEVPDVGEDPDVGGGVRAGGPADGALVDVDDLVDVLDALQGVELSLGPGGSHHPVGDGRVEEVREEGALPGTGHPGDADEFPQGQVHVDALEVVLPAASDDQGLAVPLPAPGRDVDPQGPGQVLSGEAL